MKTKYIITLASLIILLSACNNTKNAQAKDAFGNGVWELEYISGPGITFSRLYPDKKPAISFNTTTKVVSGTNSCNGYSAKYSSEGQAISFGQPGPTTEMYCGEGEKVFLQMMSKVNKHDFDGDGKLQLLTDDVPMMRFKKQTP